MKPHSVLGTRTLIADHTKLNDIRIFICLCIGECISVGGLLDPGHVGGISGHHPVGVFDLM